MNTTNERMDIEKLIDTYRDARDTFWKSYFRERRPDMQPFEDAVVAAKAALIGHVAELTRQLYRTEESSANQYGQAEKLRAENERLKAIVQSAERSAGERILLADELRNKIAIVESQRQKLEQENAELRAAIGKCRPWDEHDTCTFCGVEQGHAPNCIWVECSATPMDGK